MTGLRGRVTAWLDRNAPLIDDDHPDEGVSKLDALDGVGATRTGMPHPKKTGNKDDKPTPGGNA